jgi:TolA-binding protein
MLTILGEVFKKYILQALLVVAVIGGLYWKHTQTEKNLTEARKEVKELKQTRERLEGEVEGLKEQTQIDTKAASDHGKAQGAQDVSQAVAREKVQHEVTTLLQEAPVGTIGSPAVVDPVSAAVIDGMWESYRNSVRGAGDVPKPSK